MEGADVRVTVDDGVALEVEATGSGPGLVLVHGFGGAKEDFALHVGALATTHRVITFDHRGHGASDGPADLGAYSLDRLAADTVAVADAVGVERFRLLGHSMGGMVARRVVLAHPERVEALVLMDTSPGPVPGISVELVEYGARLALEKGMDALKRAQDELDPLGSPAYRRLLVEQPGYKEFQDRKWAALSPYMWAALAMELATQPDQVDALRHVDTPTLVMVGEQDESFVGPSREAAAALPDAQLVVIAGAGHSPQFEAPADWREILLAFLDGLDADSREVV